MKSDIDLDPEELKFLAIKASRGNQADQALHYLKQAIRHAPQDGELHYLLGAEHAQLGMYDRAAEEMERALALAPDMHTARLQLVPRLSEFEGLTAALICFAEEWVISREAREVELSVPHRAAAE